jgi:hypothetical protein
MLHNVMVDIVGKVGRDAQEPGERVMVLAGVFLMRRNEIRGLRVLLNYNSLRRQLSQHYHKADDQVRSVCCLYAESLQTTMSKICC